MAATNGWVEVVMQLIHAQAFIDKKSGEKHTALHLAASVGHCEVVRNLDGNLTLHLAARGGHSGVVASLVEAMAPVAATNIFGNTPLHLASAYARLEVVKFLLRAQAPVNNANCRGETALHLALQDGFLEVAQTLREAGGCSPETASYDMYLPEAGWWPPKTFQVFAYPWPAPYQ
eukprot:g23192.t1